MFEIILSDGKAKPVMMFPLRDEAFQTAKYGPLTLDRKMAEEMIANFQAGVLGTEPFIDEEHSEGASHGWVKDLFIAEASEDVVKKTGAGEALFAKVDWTPSGKKLLSDKAYRYISPWWGDFKDPADGEVHSNVLMGAALCNNPVLRMMPAVELSDIKHLSETLRGSEGKEVELSELSAEPQPRFSISEDGTRKLADLGMSHNDIHDALREAVKEENPEGDGRHTWVVDIYDDQVVYQVEQPESLQLFQRDYSIDASGAVSLGEAQAVRKVVSYEPEVSDHLPEAPTKLNQPAKQDKKSNGGEDMNIKKALGLPDDASDEEVMAAIAKLKGDADKKASARKLSEDPEYKKLQAKIDDQAKQLAASQRETLERKASEIAGKTIKGADGKGSYKLSAPAQQIVREILLSESPGEIKLSEKDESGSNAEVTVSLADALDRLVDNLALVKMGESTQQEHGNNSSDPEKKLADLVTRKLSENKELEYREALDMVLEENPELGQ